MSEYGLGFEEQLVEVTTSVEGTGSAAEERAWARLDSLTKPPRSLGRLERIAAHVARVQGTDHPQVERKIVLLMAADHGVVAQGVSPYPQEVTAQMVANFAAGGAAINQMAASVGADVSVTDVGVATDTSHIRGIHRERVADGTADMTHGPAMTREGCAQALLVGVRAAREAAGQGYTLIATGDMGIGNTTAAAALTCAFAGADARAVVGRGTGLDDEGLERKIAVVQRALEVNDVAGLDALGALAAVGGLEIAALAGVVIGAAESGVCVVTDGFISGAAALSAARLCQASRDYVLPSHLSAEPGHAVVLRALELEPIFELDMRLGEGTGAALAMGVIDAACRVLSGMATFDEAGVDTAEG